MAAYMYQAPGQLLFLQIISFIFHNNLVREIIIPINKRDRAQRGTRLAMTSQKVKQLGFEP